MTGLPNPKPSERRGRVFAWFLLCLGMFHPVAVLFFSWAVVGRGLKLRKRATKKKWCSTSIVARGTTPDDIINRLKSPVDQIMCRPVFAGNVSAMMVSAFFVELYSCKLHMYVIVRSPVLRGWWPRGGRRAVALQGAITKQGQQDDGTKTMASLKNSCYGKG